MAPDSPQEAEVVIIGGGIGGCSIAYHLTLLGMTDVVLLERKQLTCGTTWHAAGLVGSLWPTKNLTQLGLYSQELYASLEAETGQATGYRRTGSISVAKTDARLEELKRSASMGRSFGLDVDIVGPETLTDYYPGLNTDDVVGGLYIPKDGQTNPIDTTVALAKGAKSRGAQIMENTKVSRIIVEDGRAVGVELSDGQEIRAKKIVLSGGMWSRDIAQAVGVSLPLYACEHYYVVTEDIPGLPKLPIMRDLDHGLYFKEDAGKLLVGFFENNARPLAMSKISEDFCFDELPSDFAHFEPYLERAMKRLPILETTGIRTFFNGPESFTPDNQHLMGEAPNLPGLFIASGFNSKGIGGGGGIGKVMAHWIKEGYPPMDVWETDIRRMMPLQGKESYLSQRVPESLGLTYDMHWPFYQHETARDERLSPVHQMLQQRGACFGEVAGWERPNWFAPKGIEPRYEYSYSRQNWFDYCAEEHRAVRTSVGVYDASSFAKFKVTGADAEKLLQRICTNNVNVAPGTIVYTQWLNERGGIEADLTVTRVGEQEFMVFTSCGSHLRDWTWLNNHAQDATVEITDVTDDYAALALQGPNSRNVLEKITQADLSKTGMPFGTAKWIDISGVQVWAQRISYVGELGWELVVPAAYAPKVLQALETAGKDENLKHCGLHAVNFMRMEKGFKHFGHDIGEEDTPVEAGLTFACAFDKPGGFIGREAVLRQKEQGVPRKRLVNFLLQDPEPLLYHNEPILKDGQYVGYLTSGGYAHHLGASIGMGYVVIDEPVTVEFIASGGFEIEVASERFSAKASLRPFYDPNAERMKG